ncbi:PEROXIDASE 72-RELATED [Salix koriyanagi]|uniref:peroxidase n=1 Tax=Salix koriyanagi TaxID=2511006 RepID=A0A9Q1AIW2_9ROSI|nr:PEROXIDASE 72-RELATED [Salix koriyanagi]
MAAKAAASFIFMLFFLEHSLPSKISSSFYKKSCPKAESTIRAAIRTAIARERRMAASLIRLHFHDCFVQGCDASILLDETSSIQSEKTAGPNDNSVRDIIAVAARDASAYVGGPSWAVKLGRRDSTTASRHLANTDLPAFTESLDKLTSRFQKKGLTAKDMVALSGSHTIGQAKCFTMPAISMLDSLALARDVVLVLMARQIWLRSIWSCPILLTTNTSRT